MEKTKRQNDLDELVLARRVTLTTLMSGSSHRDAILALINQFSRLDNSEQRRLSGAKRGRKFINGVRKLTPAEATRRHRSKSHGKS